MCDKEYYAITSYMPPTLFDAGNGKRYAVAGSIWIPIGPEVTYEMIRNAWILELPSSRKTIDSRLQSNGVLRTFKVPATSKSLKSPSHYFVSLNTNHKFECTCPSFAFRRSSDCKHITAVKHLLLNKNNNTR